jgi:hypothetical protein
MSILGLVVGGVIVWTGLSYGGDASYEASPVAVEAQASVAHMETQPADTTLAALASPDPTSSPLQSPTPSITPAPAPSAVQTIYNLQSVDGISLTFDQEDVVEQLGAPVQITNDEFTVQFQIYHYPEMKIGFSEGYVDYVKVLASAGTISIDGQVIPMTVEALVHELGNPDFTAEDGLVFKGPRAVVKVFVDTETRSITSVDYFHRTSA